VDYGAIEFADKDLGLEYWIAEVLPAAIRAVSADHGGKQVQLVGWCMGGLFGLIATAAFPELPVNAVAMVASPIDFTQLRVGAPLRVAAKLTGGRVVGGAIRVMGGASAKLVSVAFKATALPTYIKKPVTLIKRRDDAEFLAHVEAVDHFMGNMHAYPGRALAQAYHRLFHANELATGKLRGSSGRVVDISAIQVPVMNIAGINDLLAPVAAVHHLAAIVPAALCRVETAPGGHLGVLTGRSAATTTWVLLDEFLTRHGSSTS
jgi:polyhydroxyalkanoate synthase